MSAKAPMPSGHAPPVVAAGERLSELAARVEALLFSTAEPQPVARLAAACGADAAAVEAALAELAGHLEAHGHAVAVAALAGGVQLLTREDYAESVERLAAPRPAPLSRAAMETLAIIAVRQPVTRAAVDELRGVHSDAAIATLVERGLIQEHGRMEAPGRPFLYVTTRRFLEHFGLNTLADLGSDGDPQGSALWRRLRSAGAVPPTETAGDEVAAAEGAPDGQPPAHAPADPVGG